jgi:hypothetical protein
LHPRDFCERASEEGEHSSTTKDKLMPIERIVFLL